MAHVFTSSYCHLIPHQRLWSFLQWINNTIHLLALAIYGILIFLKQGFYKIWNVSIYVYLYTAAHLCNVLGVDILKTTKYKEIRNMVKMLHNLVIIIVTFRIYPLFWRYSKKIDIFYVFVLVIYINSEKLQHYFVRLIYYYCKQNFIQLSHLFEQF